MVTLKMQIPWWAKLSTKLLLARLPLGYAVWRGLPIFQHGFMAQPTYAYTIFKKHFDTVSLPAKFVSLELGPGDSLFSALVSYVLGGQASYLVDTGAYAIQSVEPYQGMARWLTDQEFALPSWPTDVTLPAILESVSAQYLTQGLDSLKQMPSASVDFIWSNAVLEHVRQREFELVMQELRRILKPDGVCSHEIDLRDHLGGGLNNLRFSSHWWEQDWVARSGFYTNRIRHSEMLALFTQAGFRITDHRILESWEPLPIEKSQLSPEFRHLSNEDLKVSVFSVILQPA